jgi:hypothetical protein
MELGLTVYVPKWRKFDLQLGPNTVRLRLDASYLSDPESAVEHAREVAEAEEVNIRFIHSSNGNVPKAPNLSQGTAFITCPRAMSAPLERIGLGFIGSKVLAILHTSSIPVLMPSPVFKPWNSVFVLFGNDANSRKALRLGVHIAESTGCPLEVMTQEEKPANGYRRNIHRAGMEYAVTETVQKWHWFEKGDFALQLEAVPHDALVLLGASKRGFAGRALARSKMDIAQKTLNNNFMILGPHANGNYQRERKEVFQAEPMACQV